MAGFGLVLVDQLVGGFRSVGPVVHRCPAGSPAGWSAGRLTAEGPTSTYSSLALTYGQGGIQEVGD